MSGARSNTMLFSGEVWKAVDALGGVAFEFLLRLQRKLRGLGVSAQVGGSSFGSTGGRSLVSNSEDSGTAEAGVPRLDYFSLVRIIRPLVLGRTGGVATPGAVLRLGCHEVNVC